MDLSNLGSVGGANFALTIISTRNERAIFEENKVNNTIGKIGEKPYVAGVYDDSG